MRWCWWWEDLNSSDAKAENEECLKVKLSPHFIKKLPQVVGMSVFFDLRLIAYMIDSVWYSSPFIYLLYLIQRFSFTIFHPIFYLFIIDFVVSKYTCHLNLYIIEVNSINLKIRFNQQLVISTCLHPFNYLVILSPRIPKN